MKPLFLRLTLFSLPLMACAVASQGMNTPTPQQVPMTVEVTRQVIVTQEVTVQVPVEVTSTPTPEPTPVVNLAPFYNANSGVRMAYPVGWFTFDASLDGGAHLLAFAPDPVAIPDNVEDLEDISNPPDMGLFMLVVRGEIGEMEELRAINPQALLEEMVADIAPNDFLQEPDPIIIHGQLAARTAYLFSDGEGNEMVLTTVLMAGKESFMFLFAASLPENFETAEPIFDSVIRSIQLDWEGE
ncbi:MAG: hypothetical protein HUU38_03920 [Anaerolineales bacterium]|nr:hypothetical protein [Anaerolineales bacterium]